MKKLKQFVFAWLVKKAVGPELFDRLENYATSRNVSLEEALKVSVEELAEAEFLLEDNEDLMNNIPDEVPLYGRKHCESSNAPAPAR